MNTVKTERRAFSVEEKQKILAKTKCKCAHCGKKLTTETMTIDHVYPLNKGGNHSEYNLIALCLECNKLKSNFIHEIHFFPYILPKEWDKYEVELNKNIFSNGNDRNIFGSAIRTIYYMDEAIAAKMERIKHSIKSIQAMRSVGRPTEFRLMYPGDLTDEALKLLENNFEVRDGDYAEDLDTSINKMAIYNLIKENTVYGLYTSDKLVGIAIYMNIKNLKADNEDFLKLCNDLGHKEVYVNIALALDDKYAALGRHIAMLEIQYMGYTNNLILHTESDNRVMRNVILNKQPYCNLIFDDNTNFLIFEEKMMLAVTLADNYSDIKWCIDKIKKDIEKVDNELKEKYGEQYNGEKAI